MAIIKILFFTVYYIEESGHIRKSTLIEKYRHFVKGEGVVFID